jgi:hypothetical protein
MQRGLTEYARVSYTGREARILFISFHTQGGILRVGVRGVYCRKRPPVRP